MKTFNEYLSEGIVRKVSPDTSRANALVSEAINRYDFVMSIKITDSNANYIVENVYDLIMELVRAKMFKEGYMARNSHEAEVSYTLSLNFSQSEISFLDELRYFRNGILYYGKRFDKDYADRVLVFLDKIYSKLS